MIRLDKPNEVPQVLLNRGDAATHQDCNDYVQNPASYCAGEVPFKFKATIYRSTVVKEILERLQHDKCGYCESRPFATSAGRIDHFRPKGGVRQCKGSERIYPGYYWLAYRWDNLVLACETCNLRKSDYFPLEDPGKRARCHLDCLDREAPLLLNPYAERKLSEHLTFDGSACQPETERGRATVALLGLNRPELQDKRQNVLNLLAFLCTVAHHPDQPETLRREAAEKMNAFAGPKAPYSAMARAYLGAVEVGIEPRT